MKVLVVDDDEIFLDYMFSELSTIGDYEVYRAISAAEALELIHDTDLSFDCFLLDIDMPGMDGIELCRNLRQNTAFSGVPIIMVTVLSAVEKMDLAFSAGATDYLNKPLVPSELRGRMQMVMAKLVEEKSRLALLSSLVCDVPLSITTSFRPLKQANVVDYAVMENYAYRIGAAEMCNRIQFAVCVSNIEEIYRNTDSARFRTIVAELTEMIIDAIGPGHMMVSYLGSGEFFALLGEHTPYEPEQMRQKLSEYLEALSRRGLAIGEIAPVLKLGPKVNKALFSCAEPHELICIATGLANDLGEEIACAALPSGREHSDASRKKSIAVLH